MNDTLETYQRHELSRRVNPSITSILGAMPAQVHHAVEAREILRTIAREYAQDTRRQARGFFGFTYSEGHERGVLTTHRVLLRLFLRDLPREQQLDIGAAMRRALEAARAQDARATR
jgi:hypothetical protein